MVVCPVWPTWVSHSVGVLAFGLLTRAVFLPCLIQWVGVGRLGARVSCGA